MKDAYFKFYRFSKDKAKEAKDKASKPVDSPTQKGGKGS
jgi:hypothetical protein